MKLIKSFIFMFLSGLVTVSAQSNKTYDLFISTYINPTKTNGIHVYSFNTGTGELSQRSVMTGIANPSYLAVSNDNKPVYAVGSAGKGQAKVHSYAYNGNSGLLSPYSIHYHAS